MIYRTLTAFTLSITTLFGALTTGGNAPEASTESYIITETDTVSQMSLAVVPTVDHIEYVEQMRIKYTMPIVYWEAVAQCETNKNWQDGGHYSGGLGIAQSTWKAYGGRQYANRPSNATIKEQVVVANRIAVTGFQTRHTYMDLGQKPYFRNRVGFFGWGCIKNNRYLHPDVWRNNHRKEWAHGKKNP